MLKLNDTPEHNRFLWVLVFITLASLFFGCQDVDQTLANFWWVWLIPTSVLWWWQSRMPKGSIKRGITSFFALVCFWVFIMPYTLMLGIWVIEQIS